MLPKHFTIYSRPFTYIQGLKNVLISISKPQNKININNSVFTVVNLILYIILQNTLHAHKKYLVLMLKMYHTRGGGGGIV
jgi:hypothetical protein